MFSTGGPGSGKGRLVANLRSMFGMRLISAESIILKYLPKKVQHAMTLTTTEVCVTVCMCGGGMFALRSLGVCVCVWVWVCV